MAYSYTDQRGNGVDRTFSFGFVGEDKGYIRATDIQVWTSNNGVTYTETAGWTLSGTNQITFLVAPTNGRYIRIRRVVDKVKPFSKFDRSVTLDMQSLNNSFIQMLEALHEVMDGFYPDSFFFKSNLNMGGNKITNLAPGSQTGDATNWDQLQVQVQRNNQQDQRLEAIESSMVDNVGSRTVPYYFTAVGGETRWVLPLPFKAAILFIDGVFQNQNLGAFAITNNGIDFAEPLKAGMEVYALVGSSVAAPGDGGEPDIISVKDFGAKGDGMTDDTAAIQLALNSTSRQIYFPNGNYVIKDFRRDGTPALVSSLADRTLCGPGFITATDWVYTALLVTGARTKIHLNIDGNNFIGMAIDVAADKCEVDGCTIRNLFQPANQWLAIGVRGNFGANDWSIAIRNNVIENLRAIGDGVAGNGTGFGRAVLLSATVPITQTSLVSGNKISSILGEEGDAITVISLSSGSYLDFPVHITGNTVTTWSRRAVKVQANKANISDNIFRNTFDVNPGGMQHAVSLVQGGDHVVDSNTFINCKFASQVGLIAGGPAERVDNICITNNRVYGLGAETLFGVFGVTSYGENISVCNNYIFCPNLGATSVISVTNALSGMVVDNIVYATTSHYNFNNSNLIKSVMSSKPNMPGFCTPASNVDAVGINVFGSTNRALTLYNYDNNLSNNEIVSRIQFHQNDDSAPDTVQASLRAVASGTAGSVGLHFHTGGGTVGSDELRMKIGFSGTIEPGADNAQNLGSAAMRWGTLFAGTGAINTSDGCEKTQPLSVTDEVLDAWSDVSLITYQWLDSVRLKGNWARTHFGVIAQQVQAAFEVKGLNGFDYGILCLDQLEDGEVRWGIRPDQCLFLEAALQRRNMKRMEERLAKLEALLK